MAKEAGVVKSVNGGIARALNDLTGEVRQLSVGDIVYQGEKIVTEGSNSKVTITQTDGKDITLIGKDTLTLDQDSNNNETVADISALQQAILKGTDLNALEETAAGGPQAGGNGGDGVSLSSTSFAEGGHISNINANVGSIDALSLAAGGDNSFGVSGGSAVGAGTGTTTPKVGISISSAGSNEGGVMTYDLSLPTALTARPTKLNLNFSGGVAGKDYDANSVEYSTDGGSTWTHGTIVNLTDANQINNVKVRVKTIDNYGLDGVDLANNPTAMGDNQNQGEQDGSKYSNLNGVEYGIYKRNLTLNVTTDNDEIANSQANGKITDNDDYVNINQGLNGANIATEDGEDTLNMNTGAYKDSVVNMGLGDDVVNIKSGANLTKAKINTGEGNDTININGGTFHNTEIYLGNTGVNNVNIESGTFGDTDATMVGNRYQTKIGNWKGEDHINVKAGAAIKNTTIDLNNENDFITIDKGAAVTNSQLITGDQNDTVTINGDVSNTHIHLGYHNDTLNVGDDVTITGNKALDANIYMDNGAGDTDSSTFGTDTVEIGNNVKLKNGVGINGGHLGDTITIGKNLTLEGKAGIYGDWGDDGVAQNHASDGDDIIKVGKNLIMSGESIISGGGGNDEITIGENANISGNSTIDGGAGNDKISMTNGTKVTNSKILMGEGENTLDIARKIDYDAYDPSEDSSITLNSVKIQGGADKDVVNISDNTRESKVKLNGDTSIELGNGDNEVNIDGNVELGNIVVNPTKKIITTGNGKDNITLTNGATIYGRVVETGEGNDQINLYDGAALNFAKIETGKGNDVVRFEHLTTDPLQGYGYSAATDTKINMGDGDDSLLLTGMGNKGNYADRTSDFQGVNIDMGDNGIKRVQINRGKVETTNIKTGSGNDLVQIQDDSLMEGGNSINTGAGQDGVDITNSKLNGTASKKTKIDTGADNDHVIIRNSTLTHAEIITNTGADVVDIEKGTTFSNSTINTGEDDDTVNINASIMGTGNGNQSNIMTEGGIDKVNIASGVTLTSTVINTGAGEETIKINDGKTANGDRIVFDSSELNTGADNDIVEVTNTTFMNSNNRALSALRTDDGDDQITIKEGTIFQDSSYVFAGNGNDIVTLESGSKFIGGNVYAHDGDDKVYVNGAEFTNGGVNGGAGNDRIYINDGSKFDNGNIRTETGDDKIFINKGANLMNNTVVEAGAGDDEITIEKGAILNNTKIDGGTGYDTLKVADSSIDFSHVKNIEKLDITDVNKTPADTNVVTLSANDVLDMTDSNNKLKIDGDGNDKLNLSGGGWSKGASDGHYTTFTSGTVTVEVKDDMVNNVTYF